jgi:ankyrin repeat protein
MVKYFLEKGASVNIQDNEGLTCLHIAATLGHSNIYPFLLKYNGNIEAIDSNGTTPLLCACWSNEINIVKMLLDMGVFVNHRDKQGATALSIAAQTGRIELVNLLLKYGAHIYASSRNPIKLAQQCGFNDIVNVLHNVSTCASQQIVTNNYRYKIDPDQTSLTRNSKSVDCFQKQNFIISSSKTSTNINDCPSPIYRNGPCNYAYALSSNSKSSKDLKRNSK